MAKYVNGKLVAGKVTKPVIVNVYIDNGQVSEVTTGGFLGTIPMVETAKNTYEGTGKFRGKDYPVKVETLALGSVPPYKEYRGDQEVEDDKVVDATAYIQADKLEKLVEGQIRILQAISTKLLHAQVIEYLEATPRPAFTPWLDAIMEADQNLELPKYRTEPIYVEMEGIKVVGADIRLNINGATFAFGEGEFKHCTDTRTLLQFWTNVAIGVFPDGELYYPTPIEEKPRKKRPAPTPKSSQGN